MKEEAAKVLVKILANWCLVSIQAIEILPFLT
jgi:hypothetical protein